MSEQRFRIMILEDDPNRHKHFRARFYGTDVPEHIVCELTIVKNIQDAAKLLSDAGPFDLVLLDHDLKPEHYVGGAGMEGSGSDLTRWLTKNPDVAKRHKRYIAHSLNAVGAKRMADDLWSIGIVCLHIPFLWMEQIFWKHIQFPKKKVRI